VTVFDLLVRAERLVSPEGTRAGAFAVQDGRVVAMVPPDAEVDAARVRTYGPEVAVLPGLVDTHVHLQDPGHPEWESFGSGTRAAAAGGVTTVVDMPLDSVPVTTSAAALDIKRAAAQGNCWTDVGFWGGVVPGTDRIGELHEAGVLGFKCFLGGGTPDFPAVSADGLREALARVASLGSVLLVHAEFEPEPVKHTQDYREFLARRPIELETAAVAAVIGAARETGGRAHIVHLSGEPGVRLISAARGDGVPISAETAPHYLTLDVAEVDRGDTRVLARPPVRGGVHTAALWSALGDGTVGMIASDHSPCWVERDVARQQDFDSAPGGIASLQYGLALVWTEAARWGFGLTDVVRWMCAEPARLAGLSGKGRLEVGADADFCVLDPDAEAVIADGLQRQPALPYAERRVRGVVRETWLRGRQLGEIPYGELLDRRTA
jgi:allantoinase